MSRITVTDLHVDLIDVDDNDQDMVKGGILSLAIIAFGVGWLSRSYGDKLCLFE
mgnify:FL=1